jgi:hypothetical protein
MKKEKLEISNYSDTIIIPELEEIAKRQAAFIWNAQEIAIVKEYYLRVPAPELLKFLPGKTKSMVYEKAAQLGLVKRGKNA